MVHVYYVKCLCKIVGDMNAEIDGCVML